MIRQHSSVVLATIGAAVFVATSPAMAASENWNSRSDPLVAWEDGDRQALAYGTAYTKEGSLKNHTYYRDPRAGGDAVYTETDYNLYVQESSGDSHWRGRCCKDQSARDDSGDWVDQYDAWYYANHSTAEKGRVYYKVCEDQDWSPDACSPNPWVTFNL
ncbi:hypothetical protein [Nocardioides antri]|uniref:hypothetical protein n=1 Tax=Nocardioides antri TaxID=2607659 RepID=UPI00165F9DCB|nr:hypothetical protein [Nocardioides antri]